MIDSWIGSSIDTIVFDLGGVLIDWDPRHLYRQMTDDLAKIEAFLQNVCHSEWNSQQDAGRPFAEAVHERIEKFPEHREWIEAYQRRWTEMISGEIRGTVEILENLARQKRFRLLALTNWSAETFPHALGRFPFLRLFEGIVVSGDERVIKPNPEIFGVLIRRYQLDAKQCVFIDDVPRNVAAAQALGFRALPFTSPETLRSQLAQLSISV